MQVVAVDAKYRMRLQMQLDHGVAVRSASGRRWRPLPFQAQGLAILGPLGDGDIDRPAVREHHPARIADYGIQQIDVQLDLQVGAARWRALPETTESTGLASTGTTAEHLHDIVDIHAFEARTAAGAKGRTRPGRPCAAAIEATIDFASVGIDLAGIEALALVGVLQEIVGRRDAFEPFLGGLVADIGIGVQFLRQFAERLLNLGIAGVALHAQFCIGITCHACNYLLRKRCVLRAIDSRGKHGAHCTGARNSGKIEPANTYPEPALPIENTFPDQLVTARLDLRACGADDALPLLTLIDANRVQLMRNFAPMAKGVTDRASAVELIETRSQQWQAGREFTYGLWLRPDDGLVGQLRIKSLDWDIPAAELSYFVVDSWQRHGLATEAITHVLELAFATLGFRRICLRIVASNTQSLNLAIKLGFQPEGVQRNAFRCGYGELHSLHNFALTDDDWTSGGSAPARLRTPC